MQIQINIIEKNEVSTNELMEYAMKSKGFDFIKDSDGNIYFFKDGWGKNI